MEPLNRVRALKDLLMDVVVESYGGYQFNECPSELSKEKIEKLVAINELNKFIKVFSKDLEEILNNSYFGDVESYYEYSNKKEFLNWVKEEQNLF